jgi:hypothetical protein
LCDKSNQKRSRQEGFLAAQAFALQISQNRGCNLFAGLPCRPDTLYAKICYALRPHRPPLFCLMSPEAFLPGKTAITYSKKNRKSKAGKGPTEKRARRMACSAEAFFCLDFFWCFFVSRQKRTSLRGN